MTGAGWLFGFALLALTGCGTLSKPIDYESAKTLPPLKVPPDLLAQRGRDNPFSDTLPEVDTGALADRTPSAVPTERSDTAAVGDRRTVASVAPRVYVRLGRAADGVPTLAVEDEYEAVWRQLSRYLAGLNLEIESDDAGAGLYRIREPGGSWYQRIAFWRDERQRYQLRVVDAGSVTLVTLLDESGATDRSERGEQILSSLYDEFAARGGR